MTTALAAFALIWVLFKVSKILAGICILALLVLFPWQALIVIAALVMLL